jgi:hypothetical protein
LGQQLAGVNSAHNLLRNEVDELREENVLQAARAFLTNRSLFEKDQLRDLVSALIEEKNPHLTKKDVEDIIVEKLPYSLTEEDVARLIKEYGGAALTAEEV